MTNPSPIPNQTLLNLFEDATHLGFTVTRETARTVSIHEPRLRRPVRVNMSQTGAFIGAGILFGQQFRSVRGLRAFLARFANSRPRP